MHLRASSMRISHYKHLMDKNDRICLITITGKNKDGQLTKYSAWSSAETKTQAQYKATRNVIWGMQDGVLSCKPSQQLMLKFKLMSTDTENYLS